MKRLYTALIVLGIVFGLSLFSLENGRRFSAEAQQQVSQIIENTNSGRLEQAAAASKEFLSFWEHSKKSMSWYMRHEPLDKITSLAAHLEPLARNKDIAQLNALLSELSVRIQELYQNELPTWQNLS